MRSAAVTLVSRTSARNAFARRRRGRASDAVGKGVLELESGMSVEERIGERALDGAHEAGAVVLLGDGIHWKVGRGRGGRGHGTDADDARTRAHAPHFRKSCATGGNHGL